MKERTVPESDDSAATTQIAAPEASRPPERDERRYGGLSRRSFLRSAVGVAATAVVLGSTRSLAQGFTWDASKHVNDLTDEQLVEMYRRMLASRWTEAALKDAFLIGHEDLYRTTILGIGQEASGVGVGMALRDDDWVFGTHRPGHTMMGKGSDPQRIVAEHYFRTTGFTRGYGNTMHMVDAEKHVGVFSIVGASLYAGAGAAWAAKVNGNQGVAVSVFGDGAFHSAYVGSTLQYVSNFKLPWIGILENNGFGSGARVEELNPSELGPLSTRADGYAVPRETVDGMDVLAVYGAVKNAVDRARSGGGPTFIELVLARFHAHSGTTGSELGVIGALGDRTRSEREIRSWLARDPIPKHRQFLVNMGLLTDAQADEMVLTAQRNAAEAIEFALASPHVDPEDGLRNVFAEGAVAPTNLAATRAWNWRA